MKTRFLKALITVCGPHGAEMTSVDPGDLRSEVPHAGASRYLPVRSRCLHPGQQQGRR